MFCAARGEGLAAFLTSFYLGSSGWDVLDPNEGFSEAKNNPQDISQIGCARASILLGIIGQSSLGGRKKNRCQFWIEELQVKHKPYMEYSKCG